MDTGDLLVAAEFGDRNPQCYHMKVETSLRVLARTAQFQQVEHGLDVREEAIVPLACESQVASLQWGNCLLRVKVEIRWIRDAVLRRILAVIALVVEWRGIALVIRRNKSATQDRQRMPVELCDSVSLNEVLRGVLYRYVRAGHP